MLLRCEREKQGNAKLLRSHYEIIPGGLASRKFITINRTRSGEHLAPASTVRLLRARNSALRVHQGRGFLSRVRRDSSDQHGLHADEKDDGIISSLVARDEKSHYVG